jgi:hypothetical protein
MNCVIQSLLETMHNHKSDTRQSEWIFLPFSGKWSTCSSTFLSSTCVWHRLSYKETRKKLTAHYSKNKQGWLTLSNLLDCRTFHIFLWNHHLSWSYEHCSNDLYHLGLWPLVIELGMTLYPHQYLGDRGLQWELYMTWYLLLGDIGL